MNERYLIASQLERLLVFAAWINSRDLSEERKEEIWGRIGPLFMKLVDRYDEQP